ncbi:universal stress protein [Parabacteroides sp. Marseille-P3160]|uniref:universal stress protein n=1 Tax=Parabacteroides sp. Marseille-P3160 TaxID=1917887 RepID=UPI0009BA4983|nr:universal stress protein [Parabacteroides sp. Marseille-P3160]
MENKIVSLAIHRETKANIMRDLLENNGIKVFLKEIQSDTLSFSVGIFEKDIAKALEIIEDNRLFNYSNKEIAKIDDGRKRILVPVDFSNDSLKACRFAFSVAKSIGAKVKILHVFDRVYPVQIPFIGMTQEDKEKNEDLLTKSRKKILDLCNSIDKEISEGILPSINFSYALREGDARGEIDVFIDEYQPSLVVMGTRGVGAGSKSSDYIGSSVTADIIETTNVPIIAIPYSSYINDVKDIKHLVFLVNNLSQELTFDNLVHLLNLNNPFKVTVVHLNIAGESIIWGESEIQSQRDIIQRQYPGRNIESKLVETTGVIEGIDDLLKDIKADMIALNTKERNIWGLIFKPSTSRKIISQINTSIMILRN